MLLATALASVASDDTASRLARSHVLAAAMLRLASEGGDITNRRLATEALRMAAVSAAGDVRWDSAIGRAGVAAASSILDPLARTAVRDIGRLSTALDEAGAADLPLYRAAWNATALRVDGLDSLRALILAPDGPQHLAANSSFATLSASLDVDASLAPAAFGPRLAESFCVRAQLSNVTVALRFRCAVPVDRLADLPSALSAVELNISSVDVAIGDFVVQLHGRVDDDEDAPPPPFVWRALSKPLAALLRQRVEEAVAAAMLEEIDAALGQLRR